MTQTPESDGTDPGGGLPQTESLTVGGLVAERPGAAAVLERHGLDYCCGGAQPLDEACRERGLDPDSVLEQVAEQEAVGGAAGGEAHDVAGLSIGELCDHIVAGHHQPLRDEFDRISGLLERVVRAHAEEDPSVVELQQLFTSTRSELEAHMEVEERDLFPACRALEGPDGVSGLDEGLLPLLEHTHAETGEALRGLRELSGDYGLETAHCATHRVLLHELSEFDLDLRRHIHEENNVLFVRVRERLAAAA